MYLVSAGDAELLDMGGLAYERDVLAAHGLSGSDFGYYGSPGIAQKSDTELIKMYPHIQGDIMKDFLVDPHQVDAEAARHLGQLAAFGMNIPPHHREIGRHAEGRGIAIYTHMPNVEGISLDLIPRCAAVTDRMMYDQIIAPLMRYYSWILAHNEPFFIHDLPLPQQYVFGHLPTQTACHDQLWLVDLEPRMRTVEGSSWNTDLGNDLLEFEGTATYLLDKPSGHFKQLTNMQIQVETQRQATSVSSDV